MRSGFSRRSSIADLLKSPAKRLHRWSTVTPQWSGIAAPLVRSRNDRRPRLDHAAGRRHQAVGRRYLRAAAGRDARALRRPFPGGTVLHWQNGGRGLLCSADIATVVTDRKWLSFMRSYPNLIPLSRREIEGIAAALAPFDFDTIYGHYGHYFDRVIAARGKSVLQASVARYLKAIGSGA